MFLINFLIKLLLLPFAIVLFALLLPLVVLVAPFMLLSLVFRMIFGLSVGILGVGLIVGAFSFLFKGVKKVFAF